MKEKNGILERFGFSFERGGAHTARTIMLKELNGSVMWLKSHFPICLLNEKWSGFMSRLKRLTQKYAEHIAVPWRADTAAAQRVIFSIYDPNLELRLRASIGEFEIATRQCRTKWASYDLTDSFAKWLSQQRYANSYFLKPNHCLQLKINCADECGFMKSP